MKICTFCGYQTDNSTRTCPSCGSKQFNYICPNCSNDFNGKFCPACGTKFDAVGKICPDCGRKYFSKSCPDCGYNESRRSKANTSSATSARTTLYSKEPLTPAGKRSMMAFSMTITGFMTGLFPLSIIGLILSVKERNSDLGNRGKMFNNLALALGIVGIVMDVFMLIAFIIGTVASIYN